MPRQHLPVRERRGASQRLREPADERRSGEAEGEQGDRDWAAETVDPDPLATGAARRDNHGGRSQYDCDPENEACSPFPRLPNHVGIAEGGEDADPSQAEHPTAKEVIRAHTRSMRALR